MKNVGVPGPHGCGAHGRSRLRRDDGRMARCAAADPYKLAASRGVLRGPETWLAQMVSGGELSTKEESGARPENEDKAQSGDQKEESFVDANHVVAEKLVRDPVWGEDDAKSTLLEGA